MAQPDEATDDPASVPEAIVIEAADAAKWSEDDKRRSLAWLTGLPLSARPELFDVACRRWHREYIDAYEDQDYCLERDPLAFREQFASIYAEIVIAARDRLARLGCADAYEEGLLRELVGAVSILERMIHDGPHVPTPPAEQDALIDLFPDDPNDLVTMKQVERWVGLDERTIREKRKTEGFPESVSRVGGRHLFSLRAIAQWYRDQKLRVPPIERLPDPIRKMLLEARDKCQDDARRAREEGQGVRHAAPYRPTTDEG